MFPGLCIEMCIYMMFNNPRTVIWNGEITGKDFGYVQRSRSDPMHC
jgi:hypothetical protein